MRFFYLVKVVLVFFVLNATSFQKAFSQCATLPPIIGLGSDKFPDKLCSPVTADVNYRITFSVPTTVGPVYDLVFNWGDGSPAQIVPLVAGTTSYNVTRSHPFPLNSNCEYLVIIFMRVGGIPCTNTRQEQVISTWRTDEFNGGDIKLISPLTNTMIHEVCEGENITVVFRDDTDWNCNANFPANYPPNNPVQFPNEQYRWQQIVYNTPIGVDKIPNLRVNGIAVTGPAGVDILSDYQDPRGVHFLPPLVVVNDGDRRNALPITGLGGFGPGFPKVNDEFEITLRYWNICNPYDDPTVPGPPVDITNGDFPPVERTSIIRIIDSPDKPLIDDVVICFGDNPTLPLTNSPIGDIRWYTTLLDAQLNTNIIFTGSSFSPTFAQAGVGVTDFFVTATAGNNCVSDVEQVFVTRRENINSAPPPLVIPALDVCPTTTYIYSLPNNPASETTGGATEFVWSIVPAVNATITGGQGTRQVTIQTTGTLGPFTLRVQRQYVSAPTCPSPFRNTVITVHANPTVNITPSPLTLCEGETPVLTGNHFNPFGTIVSETWTGTSVGSVLNDVNIINPSILSTASAAAYNFTFTVTNSIGCSGDDNVNVTITPGITNVNAGTNSDLCFAAPPLITTLAAATPSTGTGTWSYVSGPDNTPTFSDVNNTGSTVEVDQPGVYIFQWEVVSGSCSPADNVEIDFGRTPTQPTATTPLSFCGLTGTLAGSSPTFETPQWTLVGGPAGGVITFSNDASPTSDITASIYGAYQVRWTFSSGSGVGACAPRSVIVNVNFNQPASATIPADFTSCVVQTTLAPISLTGGSVGGGATQGRWQIVPTFGSGNFTSNNLNPGGIIAGPNINDQYRPVAADFAAGSVQLRIVALDPDGAGPCTNVNSAPLIITLDRKPANAIAGNDFAICDGEDATLNATAATNGGTGTWTGSNGIITNVNQRNTTVTGLTARALPYTFTWTVNSVLNGTPGACTATTDDVAVTVRSLPAALDPAPNNLCETNEGTLTAIGVTLANYNDGVTGITNSTGRTVVWYANASDRLANIPIASATIDIINGTVLYTRVTDTNNLEACKQLGQVTFTVNPKPMALDKDFFLCEEFPVGSLTVNNIDLTNASYETDITGGDPNRTLYWYNNALNAASDINRIGTPTDVDIIGNTTFFTRVVNDITGCFNVAQVNLVVKPRPINQTLLGTSSPCVNATELYRVSQISGAKYNWTIPPGFVILGGGGVNEFFVLLEFPTAISGDLKLTIVLNGCDGNEITKPIVVSPDPIGFSFVPPTETICEGGIFAFTVTPDNTGSSTYNWQVLRQSNGLPGGGIVVAGQTTGNVLINVLSEDIIIRVTESNASNCAGPPQELPVIVNKRPTMDDSSTPICSGDITVIVLSENATSPVPAITFEVQVPTVLPGIAPITGPTVGTLGPNGIENDSYRNQTTAPILSLLYRVKPISSLGCEGEERSVIIDIKAEPVMDINLGKSICSDNPIEITLKSATDFLLADKFEIQSPIVYDATKLTPLTPLPTTGALVNANEIYNNSWENVTGADESVTYNVRPYSTLTGCYGNPATPVVVIIQRKPLVTPVTDVTICSGDVLSIPLLSGNVSNATFLWTPVADPEISGASGSNTNTINNRLFNNSLALHKVVYQVQAINPGSVPLCVGPTTLITVFVRPSPDIVTPLDKQTCSDAFGGNTDIQNLTTLHPEVSMEAGVTYTWFTNANDFLNSQIVANGGDIAAYMVTDNQPIYVRVLNPAASSGCYKDAIVTFDVRPTPKLTIDAVETTDPRFNITCNGQNDGQVVVSAMFGTNHTFSLDGGNFVPALLFSNLAAGSHTFRTRNAEGCIDDSTTVLIQPDPIAPGIPVAANVSCFNDPTPDGKITITASGGTSMSGGAPLSFTLLQDPAILYDPLTSEFNGLRATTYTVRIQDENTCTVFVPGIVVSQPPDINIDIDITSDYNGFDVSCAGKLDGQISKLNITGGNPGYTYVLDQDPGNISGLNSGIFDGLSANILYTITATDLKNCTKTSLPELLIDPIPLFAGVVGFNKDICAGADPTAFQQLAQPFGGIGNYVYVWEESNNINGTYGPAAGINNNAIYDAPILTDTMFYRRVVTSGTCDAEISDVVKIVVHPLPVATLSAPSQVCEDGFFTLDFEFQQGQAPYFFSYTDGTGATFNLVGAEQRPVPVLNYTVEKTFTLTDLRDFFGCKPTVYPPPVTPAMIDMNTNFTIAPAGAQCSGGTYTFTWMRRPNVAYTWTWNDGTPDRIMPVIGVAKLDTVQHIFRSANVSGNTVIPVTLTAASTVLASCVKQSPGQNITIYPAIFLNAISNKDIICSGEEVTFINSTLGGGSHRWFYRTQGTSEVREERNFTTASTQKYTFINNTTQNPIVYEMVYQVNNVTCFDETIIPITVYKSVKAKFDVVSVTPYVGGNAFADFNDTSVPLNDPNYSYNWTFGPGAVRLTPDGLTSQQVRYTSIGSKDVTLTVTNDAATIDGLTCAHDTTVTIQILLPPLVADFRYTPQNTCFPSYITITENLATGDLYEWTLKDKEGRTLIITNDILPIFKISAPGQYIVFLKTTNSITGQEALTDNRTTPINIFDTPFAAFEVVPDTIVFVPDEKGIEMRNYSLRANTYAWDFDDGETSIEIQPRHFYQDEDNYLITLITSFNHGKVDQDGDGVIETTDLVCYDTATQIVVAKAGGRVKIPNAFTPDESGPNGGMGDGLFNDVFRPVMEGVEEFHMQIFDRWGNLIFESKDKSQGWDGYDKAGRILPAGVYVYKITMRLSDSQRSTQIGDVTLIR